MAHMPLTEERSAMTDEERNTRILNWRDESGELSRQLLHSSHRSPPLSPLDARLHHTQPHQLTESGDQHQHQQPHSHLQQSPTSTAQYSGHLESPQQQYNNLESLSSAALSNIAAGGAERRASGTGLGNGTNGHSGATPQIQRPEQGTIDEILKRKRKAREYKACYPCRQRKVKCNQTVPCKTCVVREHPELCTYNPPSDMQPPAKRPHLGNNSSGVRNSVGPDTFSNGQPSPNGIATYCANGTVTVAREDWDRLCTKLITVESSLSELKSSMRKTSSCAALDDGGNSNNIYNDGQQSGDNDSMAKHFSTYGIHTRNDVTGEMVHLGGASVPALILALSRGGDEQEGLQELLGKSMLPLFGLDNESSTYPFVDLWGLPHGSAARAAELARALPSDSECLSFFRFFKETAHPIYPVILDIEKFESELLLFLINRASSPSLESEGKSGQANQTIYGQSLRWVGLLFAVLGSGCQCSALARKERELTSQVYVCCSFECLRFTNFITIATLETIQTLLVIGNVISNNMNAGVAWSLLGLTIRLAQTLGLHRICPPATPFEIKSTRLRIWWALIWQDSLLSITYDRAPTMIGTINKPTPLAPESTKGNRSFSDCMYQLCKVAHCIVSDRASTVSDPADAFERIIIHRRALEDIMADAADFLRDSRRCRSQREQLEHWVLYLHMSYTTSELCRPAVTSYRDAPSTSPPPPTPSSPNPQATQPTNLASLRSTLITSLANTVEAFLGLQNITPFAVRSWAAVHRSLSSALLLGILAEPARNPRARALLEKLVSVMLDVVAAVKDPAELNGPVARSVAALKKILAVQGSATNSNSTPSATGSTPVADPTNPNASGLAAPQRPDYKATTTAMTDPIAALQAAAIASAEGALDVDPELQASPYALMDSILWGGATCAGAGMNGGGQQQQGNGHGSVHSNGNGHGNGNGNVGVGGMGLVPSHGHVREGAVG